MKCKHCKDLGIVWADLSEIDCPECNSPVINYLDKLIKEEEDVRNSKETM